MKPTSKVVGARSPPRSTSRLAHGLAATGASTSTSSLRQRRPGTRRDRRSDGPWHAGDLLARTRLEPHPSSNREGSRPEQRRAAGRRLGTPVEHERCAPLGMVGDATGYASQAHLNRFARLVTVGDRRERLVTRCARLAKAKVASSNLVFRSKFPARTLSRIEVRAFQNFIVERREATDPPRSPRMVPYVTCVRTQNAYR
jgi:hypothetical protein